MCMYTMDPAAGAAVLPGILNECQTLVLGCFAEHHFTPPPHHHPNAISFVVTADPANSQLSGLQQHVSGAHVEEGNFVSPAGGESLCLHFLFDTRNMGCV